MGAEPLRDMLRIISGSGDGSFLAVLKNFGDLSSPSLLSFPQKGLTLALDFRNRGDETLKLLAQLDEVVLAAEGRLYAAKDARLPDTRYLASDTAIKSFLKWKDPACQSDFAKRMGWL
jgi:L-gulonolactone oxidase